MKMNPKASALTVMIKDGMKSASPMDSSAPDAEDVADNGADENTEDTCCVKCACGASLLCADCKQPTCECNC